MNFLDVLLGVFFGRGGFGGGDGSLGEMPDGFLEDVVRYEKFK
jgi:hypothetical protein